VLLQGSRDILFNSSGSWLLNETLSFLKRITQTIDKVTLKIAKIIYENEGTYLSHVHVCFSVLLLYYFCISFIILTYYDDFTTWSRATASTKETGQAKQASQIKEEKELKEAREKKETKGIKEVAPGMMTKLKENLVDFAKPFNEPYKSFSSSKQCNSLSLS